MDINSCRSGGVFAAVKVLLTAIPRSGTRWLKDSLGLNFGKIAWATHPDTFEGQFRSKSRIWAHIPPFPNVLDVVKEQNYYVIYLRRKSIRDQITSYTFHQGKMRPPPYLVDYQPYTEIQNAMRTMAQFYRLMEPWKGRANAVIYYEDLCRNFEDTVFDVCEDLGLDSGKVRERAKKENPQYIHYGCQGIGQWKKRWTTEDKALYERLFYGIK